MVLTKDRVETALIECHGKLTDTQRLLDVGRQQLKTAMVRFNLHPWLPREKGRMAELLDLTGGNISRSAALYGQSVRGFRNKARRLGLLPWKKRAA